MSQFLIGCKFQAFDDNGVPLSGGKLYAYAAGTSTPKDTYTTATLGTANDNPVILDSRGEADVHLDGLYKFVLTDSDDVEIWTVDNVEGQGSTILDFVQLSDYSDLATAVSTIGATETTLWIDADDTMGANVTIPSTLSIKRLKGNVITTTGYTLTINGPYEAGRFQGFAGTGTVIFADDSIEAAYPEWWGVDGTADQVEINYALNAHKTVKLQRATYTTAGTITLKNHNSLIGSHILETVITNTTTADELIEIGDSSDASTGDADYCTLENLYLVGGATTTHIVRVLGTDDFAGWPNPSRFTTMRNIAINGATTGRGLAIAGHSSHYENIKVNSCNYGIELKKECNALSFVSTNVSGSKETAIRINSFANPAAGEGQSINFTDTIVQNSEGSSGEPAIHLLSGNNITFTNTYFESNNTNGNLNDVKIGSYVNNVEFQNVWASPDDSSAEIFEVACDNFKLDNLGLYASAKYGVKFTGAVAKTASITNCWADTWSNAQAWVHDASSAHQIHWDSNNLGENLIRNSSIQVVQAGTTYTNPANAADVLDIYLIEKVDGGGTAPSVNVNQSATTPAACVPYSIELEITNVGVADAARRWKIYQNIPDMGVFQSRQLALGIQLKASTDLTFTAAEIRLYDDQATTAYRSISSLSTTWETFWIPLTLNVAATSLNVYVVLDAGGGTISGTGSVYIAAPVLMRGYDQPCYDYPVLGEEERRVKWLYERLDPDDDDGVCSGTICNATTAKGVLRFIPKRSVPTVTFSAVNHLQAYAQTTDYPATGTTAEGISKDAATISLTIAGATGGNACIIKSHSDSCYIDIDARP